MDVFLSGSSRSAELGSDLVRVLALGAGFLLLSLLSIGLSRLGIDVAGLWLANVFAIGICLRWRQVSFAAVATAVVLASIAGNWIGGSNLEAAALFAAGNVAHVGVSLLLIRKFVGPLPLATVDLADFAKIIGLAGGVATIVASVFFALIATQFMGWPFAPTV